MDRSETPNFIDDEDLDELDPEFSSKGSMMGRILIGLIILPSFAIWGYAYSGQAERDPQHLLDEPTFAEAAGPICDATMAQFDSLPGPLEATDHVDRAQQIRASNALFAEMVDKLESVAAGTPRDIGMIDNWLGDWRTLIADRVDFADRFESDSKARLLLTSVDGQRLERRIPDFAATNQIHSCSSPNDIG